MSRNCDKIPKIPRGNDFKLKVHLTQISVGCAFNEVNVGAINSVYLVNRGTKEEIIYSEQSTNGVNTYKYNGSDIIISMYNELPNGRYGIEILGIRNDDSDFRYFNNEVFYIVEQSKDCFITDIIEDFQIDANIGVNTEIIVSSNGVQSDWNETDSTKDEYIKNKPNVYEKPITGIPKADLSQELINSLNNADTAIQSLDGYATEDWVNDKLSDSLEGLFNFDGYINEGEFTESDNYKSTNYISLEGLDNISYIIILNGDSETTSISFYDENLDYISSINGIDNYLIEAEYIPSNTSCVRLSTSNESVSTIKFIIQEDITVYQTNQQA